MRPRVASLNHQDAVMCEQGMPAGGHWEKQMTCCGLMVTVVYVSPDGVVYDADGGVYSAGVLG